MSSLVFGCGCNLMSWFKSLLKLLKIILFLAFQLNSCEVFSPWCSSLQVVTATGNKFVPYHIPTEWKLNKLVKPDPDWSCSVLWHYVLSGLYCYVQCEVEPTQHYPIPSSYLLVLHSLAAAPAAQRRAFPPGRGLPVGLWVQWVTSWLHRPQDSSTPLCL